VVDDLNSESKSGFVSGLDLSQNFFEEAVKPILDAEFPAIVYSAALIGYGSEVLGFDTEMSSDHDWGPRVYLFVSAVDFTAHKESISQLLSKRLPRKFCGYSTSFSAAEENENGVRVLSYDESAPINHRVEVREIREFIFDYLGFDIAEELTPVDWLTFPEQKLRSLTAGRIFYDGLDLSSALGKFSYFPHELWLYLLACGWNRIEQEEHLMGRAGFVGDEIGSALIAARLVRDIMRLCFLMEKTYAPYPKWFGTAFKQLSCSAALEPILQKVLLSKYWQERQRHLSAAYDFVAQKHNNLKITAELPGKATQFHERPFLVISMGAFSKAIREKIEDPYLKQLVHNPLIGSVDQFSDSTDLLHDPRLRPALRDLYNL
jgi:hypothetical protein